MNYFLEIISLKIAKKKHNLKGGRLKWLLLNTVLKKGQKCHQLRGKGGIKLKNIGAKDVRHRGK